MSGTRSIATQAQSGPTDQGRQRPLGLALLVIGAAIVAPTALSLVTTTFPEGAPRNRPWACTPR
jgi:hypothetical protein